MELMKTMYADEDCVLADGEDVRDMAQRFWDILHDPNKELSFPRSKCDSPNNAENQRIIEGIINRVFTRSA